MDESPKGAPTPPEPRSVRGQRLAAFLYLWLVVGFASGTALLVGPVRWITRALRNGSWGHLEGPVMWVVIATFVAGSFWLAVVLHRRALRSPSRWFRVGVPGMATIAAAVALWGWLNPTLFASVAGGAEQSVTLDEGPTFLFGPYPDPERLEALRDDGFDGVISLQHPAVVPMEPQGIRAERQTASELGLRFIHAPMLPWISDNEESLAIIRRIAEGGEGKYYVHCGLGRDRVNVVKAMVERMGRARVEAAPGLEAPRTFADRVEERRFLMERGNFQVLQPDLWLVPWPNPKEGFGKLFAGQVEHVVLLMDTTDAEQAAWLDEGRRLFRGYGVPTDVEARRATERDALDALARRVRALPRPAVVIVPRTPPCHDTAVTDAFLAAWARTGGPPADSVYPGEGWPEQEGRPLPCESSPDRADAPETATGAGEAGARR